MADNTKTKVLTLRTELDPSGITGGAQEIQKVIKDLVVDVGRQMSLIQKAINDALTPLSTAATNLTAVGNAYTSSLKQMSIASNTASDSFTTVNKQITSMSTRSKNLVGNLNNAATAMAGYATASKGINTASISFRNYGQSVSDSMKLVNGQFDAATRLVRSAKNDIMDLGRIFAMVTASMVAAVGAPTKVFGDFQKELLTLKNLASDFTKGELEQFKKSALQVAYANGLMAKDIAASGIELVRLGLNAKETNMVLRQVADAALANSISIVKAAEVGLGATKAMGLGVKDLAMVLDVLTRAAVSSATDISGLSETFKYAAPIFNSAEQDIKELGKASIILSNNMIRNSQAGTTLRSMMLAFQAPTVQAQKAMKILGLEIQDTATGKIKPFTQIVQEMREKLQGVDTATKNFTLATIFGKYALSGATALINSNTKAYADAEKAINDTTLSNEKMAAGMRQGVNFQFNQMLASINNSAIALGEKLAPAVEEILKSITDLAQGFQNLPSSMQQNIADMTIFTGKVAIAGAGIVALTLSTKTLINFIGELGKVLGIAGAGGIVAWFHGIVTTLSTAFLSLTSGFAGSAAGAGALGVGVTATTATVGTLASGLVVLIGYVWALKEGWAALAANLAEEKAWETAIESAKRLEESILDANKAARKLKETQAADAGEKQEMTPLEIRRAASRRLAATGKNYQDSQYVALMKAAQSTGVYQQAKTKALEKAGLLAGLDPKSPTAIDLRKAEKEQLDIMESQRKTLEEAGLLSKEQNLVMSAEIEARNRALKGLQTEASDRKEQTAKNKAQQESLNKVQKEINKTLEDQKINYQNMREESLKQLKNQKTTTNLSGKGFFGGSMTSPFGWRTHPIHGDARLHQGQDFGLPAGTPIKARAAGKVISAGRQGGYGNAVEIEHAPGITSFYAHGLENSIKVFVGQVIEGGQEIMKVGSTGQSTGPHLHYETRKNGVAVNPEEMQGSFSRENLALEATKKEKAAAEKSLQIAIDKLVKLRSVHGQETEEFARYSAAIQNLEAQKNDAANDAAKKQIQIEEEARKKMETMYDENLQAIFNLEMDAARKRSEINKQTLSQQYDEIELAYLQEVALLNEKFGKYKDVDELIAQAVEKRDKKMLKLGLETQAELTKAVEESVNTQKKAMMTEPQREMFDIQLEIASLERARAQERGPEGEKNKQLIDSLIKYKKTELNVTKDQVQTDLVKYLNDRKLQKLQNELVATQNDVNSGKVTQFEYDQKALNLADERMRAAKRELDNAQARAYLKEEDRMAAETAAQQKLTEATADYNAEVNKSLTVQLEKIKADKERGAIGGFEAQELELKALTEQLSKMSPTEAGYNSILERRNDLLIKVSAAQGNLTGVLSGFLMKSQGVAQMSQVQLNLWEGMTITGEQLTTGFDALSDSASKFGQALANNSEIIGGLLDKLGGLASGMSKVMMGMISGNPVQVIAGLVEGLAGLVDALNGAKQAENDAINSWLEYKDSLIEVETQAQKTETRLRLLRGEITELQAAIEDQTSDRQSKEKRLSALKDREKAINKKIQDNYGGAGIFTFVIDQKTYLQNFRDLEKNQNEIAALEKELQADLLQNAMENSAAQQAIRDADTANLMETKIQEARLTKESLDDVDAAYQANFVKRQQEMIREVEEAYRKGLDVEALQKAHQAEMAADFDQYTKDRAEAQKKDSEATLEQEKETNDKLEQERQDHLKKLYDMERQSAVDLLKLKASRTYTKDDDIKADAEAERKAAGDRYQAVIEQVKGNSELEMKIKREALQAYLIEIENADDKERRLLADNSSAKAKAARDIALIEAQNSRNTTVILSQELQNQYDDLEEWKAKEIDLAMGDSERLLEIEREYQAKRVQAAKSAEDKIKDLMVNQLNDIKTMREQVLKIQSMQYNDAITQQERFLLDLNKQRDDLQRQIEFYDNQIAKQRQEFNKKDKDLFQSMLGGVNIPEEIRKGLELIANPTGVPNNRFSRDSQRKAIQERIDMLTQENENLRDLEERSSSEYWAEESRIALIQAAAANDQLTNTVTAAKMTAKEKLEVQSTLADAYKRYQEAQLNLIEDQYVEERELANAQLLQNKLDQDQRNAIIAENKYQLDLLTATYQKDMDAIDKEILSVTMAHQNMKISIDDVKASLGNMSPLIEQVKNSYASLKGAMSGVTSSVFPQGVQASSSSIQGPKNVGQTTPPAGYPITDGNYWYESTSKMMQAHSLGLKEGGIIGMIPNQDKYKGDKYPLMPGVRGDAGELLVSPIEKLRDLMPVGNNYSIMVTGNSFRDEVDFKRVMMEFARERDMRDSMSTGQFYSNLRR